MLRSSCGYENPPGPKSCRECGTSLQLDVTCPDCGSSNFLTDIEGSAILAQRLGDKAYHALLAEHNRIVREQVAHHGGQEVKSMGDGLMVAFVSAARALGCSVDIQKAFAAYNAEIASAHTELSAEPVEAHIDVCIGLNTGESIQEARDYFGTAGNLAARIANRAQGGRIVVSHVVRAVGGWLAGVKFCDAGRKQLKGILGRQRVFEVVWERAQRESPRR